MIIKVNSLVDATMIEALSQERLALALP